MAELNEAQIDAALLKGTAARMHEPRAATARYDRRSGRVLLELTNGCTFGFPPRTAQGLETATDEQLAQVEILGAGYGLHWEALDVDLSVPGLAGSDFGHGFLHGAARWPGEVARKVCGGARQWCKGRAPPKGIATMKRAPTSKADKADRTAVKHSGDPTHDFVRHADAEEYDVWFRRKVLEGLADARAGKVKSNSGGRGIFPSTSRGWPREYPHQAVRSDGARNGLVGIRR